MAWEDYKDGKMVNCQCFDSTGIALDTALCREQEPKMDMRLWRRFLERGLQPLVEQKAREGLSGNFTVMVRFLVNEDGSLSDLKALTNYGHGIEEGVIRMMRSAPQWKPGMIHGRKVKSYHTQPITFSISN
jgi:protein TonB